ncbi:MAG: ABC transporter permease, partial [Gammaproteobacteria bacterium]
YALLKYMGEQQGYALAIYRCLGASRKQMAVVLLHVFMKPSLLAFVFSNGLIYSLPLPLELNLEILLMNFGFGVLMWFILVFILVLPTLWPLLSVAPYGLLKQQEGLRISNIQARRLFLVPISSLLVLSYWLEKSNLKLIYISSGLLFGFIILGIFLETGFKLLNTWLQDKAESINFIAQRILARGQELSIQILLLTLVLTGIQTTHILAKNFSSQYTDLSKKNTPNYFLMNIEPHEKLKFESMLKIENNKYFSQIYPTVRARLLKINNSPIGYGDVSEKMNLNRLLNITWSENIPKDNNLMQGAWWEKNSIASKNIENLVSVEEKFAERMGIKIGDKITMQEGAFIWESEVFNLRQVTWENFQPNFFLIFKPSINLEFLPKTYMLSSYIPDSERKFLLDLIAKFPSMSILDFNFSIKEMKGILNQVQNFVQVNFGFMLISGFVLFWIFLKNGFPERKKEFEILRVLGASLDSLKQQLWVEWLLMAFCIALGSGLLINLICTYVSKTFLKMSYVWNWDLFGLNFLFLGFFMFLQLNFSNNKLIK